MKVTLEYGQGTIEAELPPQSDLFIPGETTADPAFAEDVVEITRQSILHPLGMAPISAQVKAGSRAVIIFPDRVKGGEHPTAHRKVAIPLLLEELYRAGVKKSDILFICSNGLHRKNTREEIFNILGEAVFNEFWPAGQIINHDSEDYEHLVDLGTTARGDPVLMNKYVYDADIAILVGHALGNPYGGYSGGYKHCSTGITHWRSIASHHSPGVMHRPDFVPVSHSSLMRTKFDEIGMHMEERMGKKFFVCDAVLDTKNRQIAVFSGYGPEVQRASWQVADKRTYVHWAQKKYDVLVFGLPQSFHYGDGMGTNPIMLMQAISAQVIRHKRILSERCVIIAASTCDGFFNEEIWPYLPELYQLFQTQRANQLPDLEQYGQQFATNAEYIRRYRQANAYHPFHGFSMISCAQIAEANTAAIYLVGAQNPGIARGMGLKTRATVEEALADAQRKFTGDAPNILALPRTFKMNAVHLCPLIEEK